MEKQKAITLIKVLTLEDSYFELVPDNEFWQRVMREQRASLKPDNEFCRGLM